MDWRPEAQKRLTVMAEEADGQAGAQGGDAGDVHSLLGFGHGTAENYVFDLVAVELGQAGQGAFDRGGGEVVGAGGGEGSPAGLADGGSNTAGDDGVSHLASFYPQRRVLIAVELAKAMAWAAPDRFRPMYA